MTEQTEQESMQSKISKAASELPSNLPYALRETIATVKLDDNTLVRVPEAWFVRDILPVLCGELGKDVDMRWWGARFGNPFKGFLIVDNADQNKVIFEVPPLLDRSFSVTPVQKGMRQTDINEARQDFKNRAYNRPREAKEDLRDALRNRLDFRNQEGRPLKHAQMLDAIFKHYGKPSIFEKAQHPEVQALSGKAPAAGSGDVKAAEESRVFTDDKYSEDLLD